MNTAENVSFPLSPRLLNVWFNVIYLNLLSMINYQFRLDYAKLLFASMDIKTSLCIESLYDDFVK